MAFASCKIAKNMIIKMANRPNYGSPPKRFMEGLASGRSRPTLNRLGNISLGGSNPLPSFKIGPVV